MTDIEQIKQLLNQTIQLLDKNVNTTTNVDVYSMSCILEDMLQELIVVKDFVNEEEED